MVGWYCHASCYRYFSDIYWTVSHLVLPTLPASAFVCRSISVWCWFCSLPSKEVSCVKGMIPRRVVRVRVKDAHWNIEGSKCSLTVYSCPVSGRIFFHLSPAKSNLNNIILIRVSLQPGAPIFPFLTEIECTCTLLCFSVGASKFSCMCTFSTYAS